MKLSISTEEVPVEDRVEFWADLVCEQLIEVDCQSVMDPVTFAGSVSKLSMPRMEIARIRAGGQVVRRTSHQLSKAQDEVILVNIQRTGSSRLSQAGRDATLSAGDLAIYSSDRPYELGFETNFEQTVLLFAMDAAPDLRDALGLLSAVTLPGSGAAASLLGTLADAAFETADGLEPTVVDALEKTIFQTIQAVARPIVSSSGTRTRLALYHLARIRAYASQHLCDPKIDVAAIAGGVGLSVAHVHRLFSGEPQSLMEWVWEQRLLGCQHDLSRKGLVRRTLTQIAAHHGFADMSHFSRAFRRRFGMSPREFQQETTRG